ncbi:hypothetical protein [Streptomyces sp. NPDC090026]|uniref:hypothetical protein n=1 Tax=Streptomyces sp. NPDC090026 TaxID=3365923 RepID=UPI003802BD71
MSAQPKSPDEILAQADTAVTDADQALASLEERVMAGDEQVGPDDIEQARGLRHFAELRREAARKKADRIREEAKARLREQALAEARAILDEHPLAEVERLQAAAEEAMAALRAGVRAHNDALERARVRLQSSPVAPTERQSVRRRGEPAPVYPELGWGRGAGLTAPFLWIDGRAVARLSERTLMDKAREYPETRDVETAQARLTAAAPAQDAAREARRAERRRTDSNAL